MPYIPSKFIGYNKKQVDDFLYNMLISHEGEISNISESIESCRREREALLRELESLREIKSKQVTPVDLLKMALERAGKSRDLISAGAEEEVKEVLKESARKVKVHDSYVNEIQNEIKKAKAQIKEILSQLQQYFEESGAYEENPPGGKAGSILPFRLKRSEPFQKEEDIIPEEFFSESQKTADGSAIPIIKKSSSPPVGANPESRVPPAPVGGPAVETAAAVEKPEKLSEDFFGSFWEEESPVESSFYTQAERKVEVCPAQEPVKREVADQPDPVNYDQTPEIPAARDAEVMASPAVAKEIKAVRHKYVVGKLAGEDLLDGRGQIIIAKNNPITPDVVERAEREGKLADLIVHMVIPGLEE